MENCIVKVPEVFGEREGELIRGISFIVVEGKMKKVARIEALGTFY